MKVLVLSKYSRKGASSRYRMFQYFPSLESKGLELTTEALFDDDYLDRLYSKKNRILSILKCYLRRVFVILSLKQYDVLWIEKELFPWVPWFIEKWFYLILRTPYIVEYDDAIFHQYDHHRLSIVRKLLGQKCDRVMQFSACVIGGNEYLAARARSAGAKNVVKIPTVVSEKVFFPLKTESPVPVIGWIGSMSTAIYLEKLRPVLRSLGQKHSFIFRVVGATLNWDDVPLECVPWSEAREVALVQSFDIGVMPLIDSPWERGKCGFKLIQYMACGKPLVADAIGANIDIVADGKAGCLVSKESEWLEALSRILNDRSLRTSMGAAGHQRFIEKYSLEKTQSELLNIFFSLRNKG